MAHILRREGVPITSTTNQKAGQAPMEHFDVIVVGAGISGIGAGYHLQTLCPNRSYVILEGREDLGGTWDLFRYPGIRSDSDMHTLGYRFRPWEDENAIADGDAILRYLHATAEENDIKRHIRFRHRVVSADWSSEDARWTVRVEKDGEPAALRCNFLFMCSGYYNYEHGYTPEFKGRDTFRGQVVHPQQWNEDIDYEGKRVVVIGSGATAVTLVPELAKKAAHVVMLQRSPTYIVSRPAQDAIANELRKSLPPKVAYGITRWKNVLLGQAFYTFARKAPDRVRKLILDGVRAELGRDYPVEEHFNPRYNPWDQRLCLVPDGDLFAAIREGRASVVTDHIECFTEDGIQLRSGKTLEADLIVTATGLDVQMLGGATLTLDGEPVDPNAHMSYLAMMVSDVPNLALSFGYTNASWTLKSDLTCEFVCRLLNHMEEHGYLRAVPRLDDPEVEELPFVDFSSGYIQRALSLFPKQGTKAPWRLKQNYLFDVATIRGRKLDDGTLEFTR